MSIPCSLMSLLPMLAAGDALGAAPNRSPWLALVIALTLAIGVGVGSLMSSRRDHRD